MKEQYKINELKSLTVQDRKTGKVLVSCYGSQCNDFIITIEQASGEGSPEIQGLWGKPLKNDSKEKS